MASRKRTKFIVIHVSATPPSWNKGAAGLRAMHLARGWQDIGYNEVINRDGSIEIGRGLRAIGAGVQGFNSIAHHIVLVGGVDKDGNPDVSTITPAQWKALEELLPKRVAMFPEAQVCGHRDLSPDRDGDGFIEPHEHLKACPCFDAIPWAKALGLPVPDIKGVWSKLADTSGPDSRNVYLQKLLKRAGYEFGAIDGIVGRKTKAAIRRFQAAAGFKKTGVFDEPTVARLRQMFEAPISAARTEAVAKAVDDIQALPEIELVLTEEDLKDDLHTETFGPIVFADPEPTPAKPHWLVRLFRFLTGQA